ncbi:hypothetical protein MCERE19_00392 [Spirosomataceae bacterium]
MQNNGTIFSFRNENHDEYLHTTDHNILKDIVQNGYFATNFPILIDGKIRIIKDVACIVLSEIAEKSKINEYQVGEINSFNVQCIITYK